MLLFPSDNKAKTYNIAPAPEYYIDVVQENNIFSVWLYHKDYGYKSYLFGLQADTLETVLQDLELILGNFNLYKYIAGYNANLEKLETEE